MSASTAPTPRVIPCLLLSDGMLVKTVRFNAKQYVGDPVNVLSIFSALEADELVLLDIDASRAHRAPPFDLLARVADQCLMPVTYGGGLAALDDVRRVLSLGFEKVVINTAVETAPNLIRETADLFGSQAVVASIDARLVGSQSYEVAIEGGSRPIGVDPAERSRYVEALGAGEILLTSIDRDGTMEGYDLELIRQVTRAVGIPVIACGGAGSRSDLAEPVRLAGASAAAAGSIWVFQGRNRSVLINYPSRQDRAAIFSRHG